LKILSGTIYAIKGFTLRISSINRGITPDWDKDLGISFRRSLKVHLQYPSPWPDIWGFTKIRHSTSGLAEDITSEIFIERL